MKRSTHLVTRFRCLLLLLAAPLLATGGCTLFGALAGKVAPPPMVEARYLGLAGHSCAVMVWTDTGVDIDYPAIGLDLGNAIQKKLLEASRADAKQKGISGIHFPYPAASVVRYQQEHPEIERMPAVEIAPQIGVERLIYIEIDRFQTRADMAVELYRGSIAANVRVVEVQNGKAKVGYEDGGINSIFPPKSPAEGIPNVGDLRIYRGLIDEFSTEVVRRFISYREEQ